MSTTLASRKSKDKHVIIERFTFAKHVEWTCSCGRHGHGSFNTYNQALRVARKHMIK